MTRYLLLRVLQRILNNPDVDRETAKAITRSWETSAAPTSISSR